MTLRPKARLVGESKPSHSMDSGAATPVASRGRSSTNRVADGNRTRLRTFTECPRRQTSTATRSSLRGSSWARTTFSWVSARRYHSTSSRPMHHRSVPPAGVEPVIARLKDEHPDRWTTAASPSPRPGSNRSLPLTGRVLVQSSYEGHELQREESNLLGDRLTAGCLTIRHRWNEISARRRRIAEATARGVVMESQQSAGSPFRLASSCQRSVHVLRRADESVHASGNPGAQLRGQESNLHCWSQKPASCRWTTPNRVLPS